MRENTLAAFFQEFLGITLNPSQELSLLLLFRPYLAGLQEDLSRIYESYRQNEAGGSSLEKVGYLSLNLDFEELQYILPRSPAEELLWWKWFIENSPLSAVEGK